MSLAKVRSWGFPLGVWFLSRVVVLGGLLVARISLLGVDGSGVRPQLARYDGAFFGQIVVNGYPRSAVSEEGLRLAMFPLYPLIVRLGFEHGPLLFPMAGLVANAVLATVFVVLLWELALDIGGRDLAEPGTLLVAFAPGSLVLSMAYSEAATLVAATACLLLLRRQRWVLAGLAGALCTAGRPNALAIVPACAAAAFVAWRGGDRRAVAAPLLAPLGFLSYMAFLWHHTGRLDAWFYVQRELWRDRTTLAGEVRRFDSLLHQPFEEPMDALAAIGTLLALAGCVLLWRHRRTLGWPPVLWAVFFLVPTTLSDHVGNRPRFLLGAFPLFLALALTLRRRWQAAAVGVSGSALLGITALQGLLAPVYPRVMLFP